MVQVTCREKQPCPYKPKMRRFQCELWLPVPPKDVFPFFADAANLEKITPPWLSFQILTPSPISMQPGTLIDYKLRVHGIPLRWRTRIHEWEPPFHFVDVQLRGPYRHWVHTHSFEPHEGGTLTRDVVEYQAPLGFITHPLFVQRDIERIFEHRQKVLKEKFAAPIPVS